MKKYLILAFLSVMTSCVQAQQRLNYDKITKDKKGIVYERGSSAPFTGVAERYFYSGALEESTEYVNGKPEGIKKRYHDNGKILYEVKLVNGLEEGLRKTYSEKGYLLSDVFYKEGKPSMDMQEYYPDGKLKTVVKDGYGKSYYADGKIEHEVTEEDGIGRTYGVNGKLEKEIDLKDNTIREYDNEGVLTTETTFIESERNYSVKEYYKNGNVKSIINYVDFAPYGLQQDFRENGNLSSEINSEEGVYKTYYPSGKLMFERYYIGDNEETLIKTYYQNGLLKTEYKVKQGKRIGDGKYYYRDGSQELDSSKWEEIENSMD